MADFDNEGGADGSADDLPAFRPRAQDLLDTVGAQIIRGMLLTAPEELQDAYGLSPHEANISLACCELAQLPAWDTEALVDAALVGFDENERERWGLEGRAKLQRRIALAMKAECLPEIVSPAQGLLLLRRHGINVFHELVDAVALLALRPFTDEAQSMYRALKDLPERSGAKADLTEMFVEATPEQETNDEAQLSYRERQMRVIVAAALAQRYDVLRIPKGGKKLLMGICKQLRPDLFGGGDDPFMAAWKEGLKSNPPRLRMADHDKYSPK